MNTANTDSMVVDGANPEMLWYNIADYIGDLSKSMIKTYNQRKRNNKAITWGELDRANRDLHNQLDIIISGDRNVKTISENREMNKKQVTRLTESQFHQIVKNSVKNLLCELGRASLWAKDERYYRFIEKLNQSVPWGEMDCGNVLWKGTFHKPMYGPFSEGEKIYIETDGTYLGAPVLLVKSMDRKERFMRFFTEPKVNYDRHQVWHEYASGNNLYMICDATYDGNESSSWEPCSIQDVKNTLPKEILSWFIEYSEIYISLFKTLFKEVFGTEYGKPIKQSSMA